MQGTPLYDLLVEAQVRTPPGDGRTRFAPASVGWLRLPRFEPLFKAVRGRRPKPLDEGSVVAGPSEPGALLYGSGAAAQANF